MGLTVSCARCHDHKFDAISQKDYYALYGIFASCRPGRKVIDLPDTYQQQHESLESLKPKIRDAIAQDWLENLNDATLRQHLEKNGQLLQLIKDLRNVPQGDQFAEKYQQRKSDLQKQLAANDTSNKGTTRWNLADAKGLFKLVRQHQNLTRPAVQGRAVFNCC